MHEGPVGSVGGPDQQRERAGLRRHATPPERWRDVLAVAREACRDHRARCERWACEPDPIGRGRRRPLTVSPPQAASAAPVSEAATTCELRRDTARAYYRRRADPGLQRPP